MVSPTVSGDMRRGFTLIELLVVMAIIATLLSIAVPRYLRKLPVDPVSESTETWIIVPPPTELAGSGESTGVWDIQSGAGGEERPYANW